MREMTIYVDFMCSATGGLSPREYDLKSLNVCPGKSKNTQ